MVLYDGQCRFCRASVAQLRALDWLGRLDYGDARDASTLSRFPQVERPAALERLQLVPPGGDGVLDGFYAVRWMAGRLPLLWIFWPLLWFPGVPWLGVRAYDWVARNRFLFGTCDESCEIPERK